MLFISITGFGQATHYPADETWIGTLNEEWGDEWSDARNWRKGIVPSANSIVIFNKAAKRTCSLNVQNVVVKTLKLSSTFLFEFDASANDLTVTRNIIQKGGTFKLPSLLTLTGNLIVTQVNGAEMPLFQAGDGKVIFNGASPQSITSSRKLKFNDVLFNNSAGSITIDVRRKVIFTGIVELQEGVITLAKRDVAIFKDGSSVSNLWPTIPSYFIGKLKKIGDDNFEFPIGSASTYAPISITIVSGATVRSRFSALYRDNAPSNVAITGDLSSIDQNGKWFVFETTSDNPTVNVGLSLSAGSGTVLNQNSKVAVLGGSGWESLGGDFTNTYGGLVNQVQGTVPTSTFGEFVLANGTVALGDFNDPYVVPKTKLDGSVYWPEGDILLVSYFEEYIGHTLNYKIFDNANVNVESLDANPVITLPILNVIPGDNKLMINLTGLGLTGDYTLEIINEKKERKYLRFKL